MIRSFDLASSFEDVRIDAYTYLNQNEIVPHNFENSPGKLDVMWLWRYDGDLKNFNQHWKVAFADKRKTRCHSSFNLILSTNYYQCLIKAKISKAGFVSFSVHWHARFIYKRTHTLPPFVCWRLEFRQFGLQSLVECWIASRVSIQIRQLCRDCGELEISLCVYLIPHLRICWFIIYA